MAAPRLGLHGGGGVQVAPGHCQEVGATEDAWQRIAVRLLEQAGRNGAHVSAACRMVTV
jgi:hypothetical protein